MPGTHRSANHDFLPSLVESLQTAELHLPDVAIGKVARLLALLSDWNRHMHLTSVAGPPEMVVRHALDSLLLLRVVRRPGSLVDVGCGNGFPGLALAVAWPDATVHLVDSRRKSYVFLEEAVRELGVGNAKVWHGRAEEPLVLAGVGPMELAVTRGFTPSDRVGRCLPAFVDEGGVAVVYTGPNGVGAKARARFAQAGLVHHAQVTVSVDAPAWRRRFDLFSSHPRPRAWAGEKDLECFT